LSDAPADMTGTVFTPGHMSAVTRLTTSTVPVAPRMRWLDHGPTHPIAT
jgi:hypothetical protein